MKLWQAGGAIALLIILMFLMTVRIYKVDKDPDPVVDIAPAVEWDCLPGHNPIPEPMPAH